MIRLVLGRVASVFLTAGGWLLAGVRTVLDLIGYSTAPDDLTVARARLDQFFVWLLSVPWWAVWGFALLSTLWLMWVSWPAAQRPAKAAPIQPNDDQSGSVKATMPGSVAPPAPILWSFEDPTQSRMAFLGLSAGAGEETRVISFAAQGTNKLGRSIARISGFIRSDITNQQLPNFYCCRRFPC
jgi:hypothetical protein